MLGLNRVRLKLLGILKRLSTTDFTDWKLGQIWPIWPLLDGASNLTFDLPPQWHFHNVWNNRLSLLQMGYAILVGAFFLFVLSVCTAASSAPLPPPLLQNHTRLYYNAAAHLPLIPPSIWQVYLDFAPRRMDPYADNIHSWIAHSPSYDYTILDKAGARAAVSRLSSSPTHAHILPLFYSIGRRVMRADFLRYLLLAMEGGVYSDMDTELLQPIRDWVPAPYRNRTRLIVGLEADQDPPVQGTSHPVQFCQWTLAAAPGHAAMWDMVQSILEEVQRRPFQDPPSDVEYSDEEVLEITGPAGWTVVVFKHLERAAGGPFTWRNLTGLKEPVLVGDILVLPIDAFATGVPHSGAVREGSPDALVRHHFGGSWRNDKDSR